MPLALVLASLLAAIPGAPAGGPTAAPAAPIVLPASPPAERIGWYGQPSAIIDGLSIAALFGGVAASGSQQSNGGLAGFLGVAGFIGYGLGGPGIHLRNGHYGRAAASLGLRLLGATVGGAILINRAFKCDPEVAPDFPGCQSFTASEMLLVSFPFVVSAAVDDFLLAYGTIRAPDPSPPAPTGPSVAPFVGPGWALLTLRSTF